MMEPPLGLSGWKPNFATELLLALAATGLAVAARAIVDLFAPGVIPYIFVFPAAIFASLLAGARSGLIAAAVCQLLAWYFIIPPHRSFAISTPDAIGLIVATASIGLTIWAVGSFRTISIRLRDEKERRVELLSLALREVDHRTRNNFHIAASLLLSRASGEADLRLRDELQRAASRLQSLAAAYSNLALSSADLSTVLLHEHLREICDRVREGMLPAGVTLSFDAEPVQLPAEAAVSIALIVNECLTNAAKHAFPDGFGDIAVWLRPQGDNILITIEDDGRGREAGAGSEAGTGSRLIRVLARALNADFQISDAATIDRGTRCELRVPLGN